MKKCAVLIVFGLFIAGCGLWSPSKYAPYSSWGQQGYRETPLDSSTYQVTFSGNAATAADVVDRYALYRAAELTVEHGFDYFVVVDAQHNEAHNSTTTAMPTGNNTEIQHTIDPQTGQWVPVAVTTTNYQTMTTTTTSHTVTKTVRMFKGERPADNLEAYDAKSMIQVMGPTIDR